MTAGWTGSRHAAVDVAWRAWRRLGVDAFGVALGDTSTAVLGPTTDALADPLATLARLVMDECEVRLYGEQRERVVAAAQRATVQHVLWAVVEAVERELMRPEPEAYVPPPVGYWIRGRWVGPRHDPPAWDGRWHRFVGDVTAPRRQLGHAINDRQSRSACGVVVVLRYRGIDGEALAEAAIAETMPGVDACRRCARGARPPGRSRMPRREVA